MALKMRFEETGIAGPISIFSASECHAMKQLLMAAPPPLEWGKGHVVFYPAGTIHGMRNAGEAGASYLVFEFH